MALAGSLATSLSLESASFISGLKKAAQQTGESAASIEKNLNLIVNAGKALAGGAIAQQIFALGQRALDYASSLGETAQQLGVTTKDLQIYRYAATQVGIEQEVMDKGLAKLTVTLGKVGQGAKEPTDALKRLGVSAADVKGKTAGDAIGQIADGLGKITDPAARAAIEVALFGKAGQQLDTLLAGGSAAIGSMAAEAERLGLVLSDEQIAKADNAADAFARVKVQLEANIAGAVSDNADAIEKFANQLGNLVALIPGAIAGLNQLDIYAARAGAVLDITLGRAWGIVNGNYDNALTRAGQTTLDTTTAMLYGRNSRNQVPDGKERAMTSLFGGLINRPAPVTGGVDIPDEAAARKAQAAAEKALREAETARKRALAQEDRFRQALGRDQDEYLGLRERMTTDVTEQAYYQKQQVASASKARDDGYRLDVQQGQLTALAADGLIRKGAINDDLKREQIQSDLRAALAEQAFASAQTQLDILRTDLTARADLATSTGERRDIALKLLDLDERSLRAAQQKIIDDENASDPAKADARRQLAAIDALHPLRAEKVNRDTESPGAAYLRTLNKTTGEIADGLESSGVSALEKFNASLDESVKKTLHLHGVLGDIVGDLIDMAIKQAVIKPLAESLFGGGSGGGFLSSIFGKGKKLLGFAAGGRPPLDVPSIVGENGPELFIPDVAGRVASNDNLRGMGGGGNTIHLTVDARGASSPADVRAAVAAGIAQAQPYLTNMAVNETFRQAGRTSL